jgi:hypothetical protein
MLRRVLGFSFVFAICALTGKGMWRLDHFPREQVLKTYGCTVTDDFLHRLERSSVRFNNGGSGSFVSPRGLLFTNRHAGMDCIQKLSSGELIGILFDGNMEGLENRYLYTEQARSAHVASNAVVEAPRKVYHAERILNEIEF